MWPLTGSEIEQAILGKSSSRSDWQNTLFTGVCTDSRQVTPDQVFVAIAGEKNDGHAYVRDCLARGVKFCLVNRASLHVASLSPEQREKCLEVEHVVNALRSLAGFMRHRFSFPVIAIGGSNGKTTTKEMLASLLSGESYVASKTEKSENGFLGLPLTLCQTAHCVLSPPHALVLEIGIDATGAMREHVSLAKPDMAVLTVLGPEHLEGLGDWETAAREELLLFTHSRTKRVWNLSDEKIQGFFQEVLQQDPASLQKDILVAPSEQRFWPASATGCAALVFWRLEETAGTTSRVTVEIEWKESQEKNPEVAPAAYSFLLPLPGAHHAVNFALAFAVACFLKRTPRELRAGWKSFVPPPMRSNLKILRDGLVLLDDSYNASPMSVDAALLTIAQCKEWQHKKKIIVLGDMLDLGAESIFWHEWLVPKLQKIPFAHLCFYGAAMYTCYRILAQTEKTETDLEALPLSLAWLPACEHPCAFLQDLEPLLADSVVLVKGSRGMRLDRFVRELEERFSHAPRIPAERDG